MTTAPSTDSSELPASQGHRRRLLDSDFLFLGTLWLLGGSYVALIVLLLLADALFTAPEYLWKALCQPEIQASLLLTLQTCSLSALLSLLMGVPLAYLLSREKFPGRLLVDLLVEVPLMLPPLVLGLSLLILFHFPISGWRLENWLRQSAGVQVTYHLPAIVLAQLTLTTGLTVRMMRGTFDRISPRAEHVARTLGCSRGQAFWRVCLPQASSGMVGALLVAWARAMGEFGPILVFAGTTRFRTEVLSTSVYLELGTGSLQSAVAVALLMIGLTLGVLLHLRLLNVQGR